MTSSRSKPLYLLVVLLGLVCVGVAVWWWGSVDPDDGRSAPLQKPAEDRPIAPIAASEPEGDLLRDPLLDEVVQSAGAPGTSVIWPLEVQLTLVARAAFERRDGVAPPGEGASAALQGHVWGPSDEGLRATISFLHGSNKGRTLRCDGEGAFGATDLYPGLNIVAIETPIGFSAEREVRLRSRQEDLLNIGFGRPAAVYGRVLDNRDGAPLVGAEVMLDGKLTTSGEEGVFYFPQIASGVALATVYKPGFARYRESVPITAGRVIEADKLEFRLSPGASLEIVLEGAAGNLRSPAQIFLFPVGPQRVNSLRGQQTYPWHLVSPIELLPGSAKVIEGLPDGHVIVTAFRPGAVAEPASTKVRVYEGKSVQQVLKLLPGPALRGRIVRAGKPVESARVRLEAPNRQMASEVVLQKDPEFNQELVFPHLPAGLQELLTDGDGRFQFTLFPDISSGYYLTAETLDGLWRGGRSVRAEIGQDIELELQRTSQSAASLCLGVSPRFQGLPVAVRVMGAPRDVFELSPREELLEIGELEAGTWRLDVAWHDQEILRNTLVQLGADREPQLFLKLPLGAVDGQSAEERQRAGR